MASIHLCPWNKPFITDLCHSKGPGGVIAAWIPVGTSSKPLAAAQKWEHLCLGRTHSTEGANRITKWYLNCFIYFSYVVEGQLGASWKRDTSSISYPIDYWVWLKPMGSIISHERLQHTKTRTWELDVVLHYASHCRNHCLRHRFLVHVSCQTDV